jgi:hypothetical protein
VEENTLTLHHFVAGMAKIVIAPISNLLGAWLPALVTSVAAGTGDLRPISDGMAEVKPTWALPLNHTRPKPNLRLFGEKSRYRSLAGSERYRLVSSTECSNLFEMGTGSRFAHQQSAC